MHDIEPCRRHELNVSQHNESLLTAVALLHYPSALDCSHIKPPFQSLVQLASWHLSLFCISVTKSNTIHIIRVYTANNCYILI